MQLRHFGREISNIISDEPLNRAKRNLSFLAKEKPSFHLSPNQKENKNKSMMTKNIIHLEPIKEKEDFKGLKAVRAVPEYYNQILKHLRAQEKKNHHPSDYKAYSSNVDSQSRGKLIDWICEVHIKYKMFPETLYMIIGLMDTYFAANQVPTHKMQLVAVASLFIAAKYQETYQVPQLSQLVKLCGNMYTKTQILEMEASIIHLFNFEIILSSSYKFFEALAEAIGLAQKNFYLCQYVLQLSLLNPKFLIYPPSLMASASIYLIKKIRRSENSWSSVMTSLVQYKQEELRKCAKDLCTLLQDSSKIPHSQTIRKKFSQSCYHQVTKIRLERKDKH